MRQTATAKKATTDAEMGTLPWTAKELAQLREMADKGMSSKDAAKALGRPMGGTKYKAMVEGIRFHSINQPIGAQLRHHHAGKVPTELPGTGGRLTIDGMTITPELVTPDLAQEWLARNQCNRALRSSRVDMYAQDMRAGRWLIKPACICFDTEGRLGNGQHTLTALIAAKAPQWLLVARNVTREVIATLDRGIMRNTADIAKFLGVDTSNTAVSTARLMAFGTDKQITTDLQIAAVQLYEPSITWASERVRGRGLRNAPLLAAVAKAWYQEDRERLAQFCEVLCSGVGTGERDASAIRLRDMARDMGGFGGPEAREEMHYKALAALAGFLKGQNLTKLYATGKEPFKYPRLEDTEVQP